MLFDLIQIWLWRDLDCFNAKARQYKDSTRLSAFINVSLGQNKLSLSSHIDRG